MTNERNAAANLNALQAAIRPVFEGLEVRSHFSATPTANPGGPYTVAEGQSVVISGLTSTDSDGTIAAYQWDTNYSVSKGFKNRLASSTWTFTADNSGTRTIALRVVDNNGDVSAVQTATINITDVAPTITLTAPNAADEASAVNVSWSYTDPASADVVTAWDIDWGDGETATYAGTATAANHTYAEDGSYVMTLTATQADGLTSVTHNITVNNVPALIDVSAPATTIDEGEMVQMDFTSPNRSGTLDSWTIDWGDGNVELLAASRSHAAHQYLNSGTYDAVLTAMEPDGGSSSTTLTYTVNNVAADIAITGAPMTGTEGSPLNFGSTVSDPGLDDTHTYGWTVYRDGEHYVLPNGTTIDGQTFTFTPADNGSYVVRLSVVDDEGAIATVNSDPIVVANANPTATISGEPVGNINEGASVTVTAAAADAGVDDTFSYSWTITKDGSDFVLPENAVTDGASLTFIPTDNGTYVATVVVTDNDGGTVTVSSASIIADNVAPTAGITNAPTTADEGDTVSVGSSITDAGDADTFTYAWSVTKDSQPYAVNTPTSAAGFSFVPTDNGSYEITLLVTDKDGATDSITSAPITVSNVAPTATLTAPETGTEGSALNFTVAASDAGSDDTQTYLWNVTKDGQAYNLNGATDDTTTFAFTPDDNGSYEISVTVSDNDGGSVTKTATINVLNADPVVTLTGARPPVRKAAPSRSAATSPTPAAMTPSITPGASQKTAMPSTSAAPPRLTTT
ncbi:MAG: PKD domain-containing protein [Tepidisphaeraceae bacterium]